MELPAGQFLGHAAVCSTNPPSVPAPRHHGSAGGDRLLGARPPSPGAARTDLHGALHEAPEDRRRSDSSREQ